MSEITVKTIAIIQNAIVNISILDLLLLIYPYYNDILSKKVLPM